MPCVSMLEVVFRQLTLVDGLHHRAVTGALELEIKFRFWKAGQSDLDQVTALRVLVTVDDLVRQLVKRLSPPDDFHACGALLYVFAPQDIRSRQVGFVLDPFSGDCDAPPRIHLISIRKRDGRTLFTMKASFGVF